MNFVKKQPSKCGYYNPVYPEKYIGSYPIRLMSSWETIFCKYCDYNPMIISWSSEKIRIPYKHPFKRDSKGLPKTSYYYPDFIISIIDKHGCIEKIVIEIKPYKEMQLALGLKSVSNKGNRSLKTKLYEQKTLAINSSKWKAAERYCLKMGYKFKIITEKQLIKR